MFEKWFMNWMDISVSPSSQNVLVPAVYDQRLLPVRNLLIPVFRLFQSCTAYFKKEMRVLCNLVHQKRLNVVIYCKE
ncbi:MAG: hypothetical protein DCC43_04185 [Candidatus Brocadia sp.]|nr:hypothetical protein [Candidatus Brocadia sp. AMX3]RIK02132.1 MAG: hypothetical protein DCC43_04185 [Candidatus Brocadia sp.]